MRKVASAFAPANISCFFKIYNHKNPRWAGSLGAGFTVDKGVIVSVTRSSQQYKIFFNGKQTKFPTVATVLAKLGDEPLTIQLESPLPLGCGFGLSGASALATAYAVNTLLHLGKSRKELAIIAHTAEVINKTGLGDVVNQHYGGFLVKFKPSSHFIVQRIPIKNVSVYCKYFSSIPTKSILTNKAIRKRINDAATIALAKIEHAQSFSDAITIAKEFVVISGLLKHAKVKAAIDAIEKRGGHASMIILGNAVFSNIPFEGAMKLRILDRGAQLL